MKVKEVFEGTKYTFDDFVRDFRVVTEANCKDALRVAVEGAEVPGYTPTDFVGWLVAVVGFDSYGNKEAQRATVGTATVEALERLRMEDHKIQLAEMDMGEAYVIFPAIVPDVIVGYPMLRYMRPVDGGVVQVGEGDWTIWKERGLVK